jgi:SSS family solute:Na+ symporter
MALKHQVAVERLPVTASPAEISNTMARLTPADYGDKVMPHFMVTRIPAGLVGLIVAAILSAAMSTISSGMNSSATVFTIDIYKRYFKPGISEKQTMNMLHIMTVVFGIAGMIAGIGMIGVKSILDVWWQLSGIFAAGMLGLFLLGIISRQTKNHEAIIATAIGVLVILWLTFPTLIPENYAALRSTLNTNMIIVIGTLTIFLTGVMLTRIKKQTVAIAE